MSLSCSTMAALAPRALRSTAPGRAVAPAPARSRVYARSRRVGHTYAAVAEPAQTMLLPDSPLAQLDPEVSSPPPHSAGPLHTAAVRGSM